MDPINPWLDADEVRHLAESLMPPRKAPSKPIEDTGFNETFVGFTAQQEQASPAPAPASTPTATPAPTSGSFEDQCQRFLNEMRQECSAEGLFILDRDGRTVFGQSDHPHLHFIARSLTTNAERRGLPKGHIHLKVGPGQILEIIPVSLPGGGWVAGTVVPMPLAPDAIERWKKALAKLRESPTRG